MCRLQFGTAATQSLGLPQAAERRRRGLAAFFWLLGSAGSGNTYNLWDHQNRADPGLGLVVADTANVPSRPQNRVVAAFLEKDLFFNGLLAIVQRFARFWMAYDPRTEIPEPEWLGPSYRRRAVHVYSRQEIANLLGAASDLGRDRPLRGRTFCTLLGLLDCTGLRIGEALGRWEEGRL